AAFLRRLRDRRPIESVAGAEGRAFGAQQDDVHGAVGVGVVDRGGQLVAQRGCDRVVLARPRPDDRADAGLGFGTDGGHADCLARRRAGDQCAAAATVTGPRNSPVRSACVCMPGRATETRSPVSARLTMRSKWPILLSRNAAWTPPRYPTACRPRCTR